MEAVTKLGLLMAQLGMWMEDRNGQWLHDSHIQGLP